MDNIDSTILKYRYLVDFVIKKYFPTRIDDEDIEQVGLIGLWKAIKNKDKENPGKFENYAIKSIKNSIIKEIAKENSSKRKWDENVSHIYLDMKTGIARHGFNEFHDLIKDERNNEFIEIAIKEYVSSLSPVNKKIFTLIKEGQTIKNISETLGISVGSVHKIISDMKKDIKRLCY